jgi:hypothetical protein
MRQEGVRGVYKVQQSKDRHNYHSSQDMDMPGLHVLTSHRKTCPLDRITGLQLQQPKWWTTTCDTYSPLCDMFSTEPEPGVCVVCRAMRRRCYRMGPTRPSTSSSGRRCGLLPSLLIYFPDWVGLTPSYTILFMTSLAVCLLCAAVQGHVCTPDPYHGRDPALPLHGHQVRRSAAQGVLGSQDKKLPSDDYLNEVLY